jgi:6-phosphogluconolactonase
MSAARAMAGPVVRGLADAETVARAAAGELVRLVRTASPHQHFSVALAGGRTPKRSYELLAAPPLREMVRWAGIEVFFGDERAVAPDHADSNYRMARESLLDHVPLPPGNVHRMEAERADRDAAARDYAALLPGALDLVLLGLGPDGHTASLFPGSPALGERGRLVVATPPAPLAPRVPRMTLTLPALAAARHVLFVVTGADKAGALAAVLEGPRDPVRIPAQGVEPTRGTVTWLVDRAAAAKLARTNVCFG